MCSALALTTFQAGDHQQALEMQHRAAIVYERVLGIDHPQAVHSLSSFSVLLHNAGCPRLALKTSQRYLYLLELIAGREHPMTAIAHVSGVFFVGLVFCFSDMMNQLNFSRWSHDPQ